MELARWLTASAPGWSRADTRSPCSLAILKRERNWRRSCKRLVTPPESSAAQEIARLVPASTHVIKAFNTIFSPTLLTGQVAGQPLDVFIAGDDDAAKATVSQLVADGGMRPIDAGPLAHARYLEALGFLGIRLPFSRSAQFQSAWKLLA